MAQRLHTVYYLFVPVEREKKSLIPVSECPIYKIILYACTLRVLRHVFSISPWTGVCFSLQATRKRTTEGPSERVRRNIQEIRYGKFSVLQTHSSLLNVYK